MNSSASKPAPTSAAEEDVVMPALPVVDPHFHLWNTQGYTYFAPEFLADVNRGTRLRPACMSSAEWPIPTTRACLFVPWARRSMP